MVEYKSKRLGEMEIIVFEHIQKIGLKKDVCPIL